MSPVIEFKLKRTLRVLADLIALSLAYIIAFYIRFDGILPFHMVKRMFFTLPYIVGFQFFTLTAFRVRQINWRHVTLRDAVRVAYAVTAFSMALLLWRLIVPEF